MPVSVVPLSVISWEEAIKLVYTERATIVEEYKNWVVNSPTVSIKVPSVIMLKEYNHIGRASCFSRSTIFLRDRYTCQYCEQDFRNDQKSLTLDHVVPRYHGGKTRWDNIVAACDECNKQKSHFCKMQPKNKPRKPTYWQLAEIRRSYEIQIPDENWVKFLGWDEDKIVYHNKNKY